MKLFLIIISFPLLSSHNNLHHLNQNDSNDFLKYFKNKDIPKGLVIKNLRINDLKNYHTFYGNGKFPFGNYYILRLRCMNKKEFVREYLIVYAKSHVYSYNYTNWGYYINKRTFRTGDIFFGNDSSKNCTYLIRQQFKSVSYDSIGMFDDSHKMEIIADTVKFCK
jgi:hypothetical protein